MDKKSKILIASFFIVFAISIMLTYYRVTVKKDYLVSAEVSCEPETERCFVKTCDPQIDENCSEDLNEQVFYYKIVNKNYEKMLTCDSQSGNCPNYSCETDEKNCEEIFCNESNVIEGEFCNDPKTYLKENSKENSEENVGENQADNIFEAED